MLKAQDFVEARLYKSEEDDIQDALRHLLGARPELRIQLAEEAQLPPSLDHHSGASLL